MFVDLSRHLVEYIARVEFTGTNSGPLQMGPDATPIPATGKPSSNSSVFMVTG